MTYFWLTTVLVSIPTTGACIFPQYGYMALGFWAYMFSKSTTAACV